MPLNTYGPKAPFKAKVKSVEKITGPKATGETCHIILETEGKIPFWEGQSYGVIPPVRRRPSRSRFACSHRQGPSRAVANGFTVPVSTNMIFYYVQDCTHA